MLYTYITRHTMFFYIVDYTCVQEIKKISTYCILLLLFNVESATASFKDFVTVPQENSTNQTAEPILILVKVVNLINAL